MKRDAVGHDVPKLPAETRAMGRGSTAALCESGAPQFPGCSEAGARGIATVASAGFRGGPRAKQPALHEETVSNKIHYIKFIKTTQNSLRMA